MKKTIALFTLTCLVLMLGIAGCGYNTQPNVTPSPMVTPGISPVVSPPAGQTGYRTYPYTGQYPMGGQGGLFGVLNTQDCQAVAQDLESLPNVQDASVAILGNTCLVGVQPGDDNAGNVNTMANTNAIKDETLRACNARNLNVNQVLVTTDPTLCRRIENLMNGTFGIGRTGTDQTGTNQTGQNVQQEFQSILQQMGGATGGRTNAIGGANNAIGGNTTTR